MGKDAFRLLMVLLPFTNIITNRIGKSFGIYILLGLFVISFISSQSNKLSGAHERRMMSFCAWCAIFVLLYAGISFGLGINNVYYVRFYGLFMLLLPFVLKKNAVWFYYKCLPGYLKYLMVLITISIIADTILMAIGMLTMQPMYSPEQYTYTTRPFGLFGQPSVNSTLLCFFYIFYNSIVLKGSKGKDILFIIITLGVLLQGSGSGFISYFFVLLMKFGLPNKGRIQKISKRLICLFIFFAAILVDIVLSNRVEKISINYILELVEFCSEELWSPYLASLKSPFYIWFGVPNTAISIDFGPLFIVATVGLLFFAFLTLVFIYLFKKAKQVTMKIAIIMLLVGNLHYPVMFYFEMNFMWSFIIYHIFVGSYASENSCCDVNLQSQAVVSKRTN